MKQEMCIRPGCGRTVISNKSKYGLCYKCTEYLEFLMWALEKVKFPDKEDKKKTKSGLILP